jgi:ankyrin repeat protein
MEGNTPLILSVLKSQLEITNNLLINGANIDHRIYSTGNSPLHIAVINNNLDMIQLLLSYKPNINISNKKKETPIDLAAISSKTEIYTMLANYYNMRDLKSEEMSNNNYIESNIYNTNNTNNYEREFNSNFTQKSDNYYDDRNFVSENNNNNNNSKYLYL